MKLSKQQKIAVELGQAKRNGLIRQTKRIARKLKGSNSSYNDFLIAGPSGTGKSYNIEKTLDTMGLQYYKLTGNVSIFGFMGNLMYLHSQKPAGQKLAIYLDDTDFLFEPKNINILKMLTSTKPGDRKFEYTKAINEKAFSEAQQQVLPNYLNEGTHGLTIPCEDFMFIFASNIELADETQIDNMTSSQKKKANHDLAIRGRFKPYDFQLNKEEKWGWIFDAAINDGALDMLDNEDDKIYLMDWMWSNWDSMKETSIRTIEKMAEDMLDEPEDYKDYWVIDYLAK